MSSEYKYEVRGYRSQHDVQCNGSSVEVGCDTLKEAQKRARFVISESEMMQSEMSQPLGYSQVVNRFTGEVINDYFNDSICQQCGHWHRNKEGAKHTACNVD
jgi:hypothetical protein